MKYILQYFLPVSPFLTEIITDYVMIHIKGKADWFNLWHRIGMIIGVVLILILLGFNTWQDIVKALALASLPYCFFDPILSWLRKKRGLDYQGQTKNWDKWYTRYNPYAVMTARIICACVLLGLIIWL